MLKTKLNYDINLIAVGRWLRDGCHNQIERPPGIANVPNPSSNYTRIPGEDIWNYERVYRKFYRIKFYYSTKNYSWRIKTLNYPTPQHISLYPDTPPRKRSVLRGKRFVEKILDTGKKVDLLRCANPQSRKKSGAEPLHSGNHFFA